MQYLFILLTPCYGQCNNIIHYFFVFILNIDHMLILMPFLRKVEAIGESTLLVRSTLIRYFSKVPSNLPKSWLIIAYVSKEICIDPQLEGLLSYPNYPIYNTGDKKKPNTRLDLKVSVENRWDPFENLFCVCKFKQKLRVRW